MVCGGKGAPRPDCACSFCTVSRRVIAEHAQRFPREDAQATRETEG